MGAAASIPDLVTEEQFHKLAADFFDGTAAETTTQFITQHISSWPISKARLEELHNDAQATTTRRKKQQQFSKRRPTVQTCFTQEMQQSLQDCVSTAVQTLLKQLAPNKRQLAVVFAEIANHAALLLYQSAKRQCDAYAKETLRFTKQETVAFHHTQIAARTEVAVASPPLIESTFKWTAPQDEEAFQETKENLLKLQRQIEQPLLTGTVGSADVDTTRKLTELAELADKQVQFFRGFLQNVRENEAVTCAKICVLTEDLNPQHANVYFATGNIVKSDKHYAAFNDLERSMFDSINERPKPTQPTSNVVELVAMTARTKRDFDDAMMGVQHFIDGDTSLPAGGAVWKAAPTKKVGRVIEKLCLHPEAHSAVASGKVASLDAGGMLDTVRGMFLCSTMGHATAVLAALQQLEDSKAISLERSKNRFATPSAGGWMDCLVNLRMSNGLVCEVQIVHRLLLTVRSELGAHHSYATYRVGAEILESLGFGGLLCGPTAMRRVLLEQGLKLFVDSAGQAITLPPVNDAKAKKIVSLQQFGTILQPISDRTLSKELYAFPPLIRADLSHFGEISSTLVPPVANTLTEWILHTGFDGVHVHAKHCQQLVESLSAARSQPCTLLSQTMEGHTDRVCSVAFSPDGKVVASGSVDRSVKLWNAEDGSLIQTMEGHTSWVYSVAFSPDGKVVACGSADGSVKLWNAEDGSLIHTTEGHTHGVRSVAFSPDGKVVASGSEDKSVKLWNTKDWSLIQTMEGHTSEVWSVAFSPDGKVVASGSEDKSVKLWNAEDGSLIQTMEGHTHSVRSVAFSPDGRLVASGSIDKSVKLWNAEHGSLVQAMEGGHTSEVMSVAFSPDGKVVASGSADTSVKLWNAEDGNLIQTMKGHADTVLSVALSPNGKVVASGSWDTSVKLWNAEDASVIKTMEGHTGEVYSVAVSPDGKVVASGSRDKSVKLWNAEDGSLIKTMEGHTDPVLAVAFSPDGKVVASGSSDKSVKLWNAEDGSLIQAMKGHTDGVCSVVFSPHGKVVASGSDDGSVKLWNAEDGSLIQSMEGHTGEVYSVAVSPDGKVVACGSDDGSVKLWNAEDASVIQTMEGHTDPVLSVAFSPDGKVVASVSEDTSVKLWNAEDGSLIHTMERHTDVVCSVAFSPDGKVVASGSWDKSVKLWNAEDGSLIQTMEGHTSVVCSVAFSPDGKVVASGSNDKSVKLWSLCS